MTKQVTKQEAADFIRSYSGRTLVAVMHGNGKEANKLGVTYKKMTKIYEELDRAEREKPFTDEVAQFMKDNPSAESVRDEMANLLESGSAKNLQDAFFIAKTRQSIDRKIELAKTVSASDSR